MVKKQMKPVVAAIGAAMVGTLSMGTASAADNPFGLSELDSGYMQLAQAEGKCGGDKMAAEAEKTMKEGKCGEGKCGGDKMAAEAEKTMKEGKCGEGKCGDDMKSAEGKCGGDMKSAEGKCGGDVKSAEGKCGGNK